MRARTGPGVDRQPVDRDGTSRTLALLLVVLVSVVGAVATLALKHSGERSVQAQQAVQAIATELRAQDGLEWRAISAAKSDVAIEMTELDRSTTRMQTLIDRAREHGITAQQVDALHRSTDAYSGAVRHELQLLASGQSDAAREYDESTVDPAFEGALRNVEEALAALRDAADRSIRISDIGLLATVLTTLAVSGAVLRSDGRRATRHKEATRITAKYQTLVDQSHDLVMVTSPQAEVSYSSPAAQRLLAQLGVDESEFTLDEIVHPDDLPTLWSLLHSHGAAAERVSDVVTVRLGRADGWRHYDVSVQDLTGREGIDGLVVTARDITMHVTLRDRLAHLANHDNLTDLPNRTLLKQRFEETIAADGAATGFLLIDLDRFKEVNDTLGHHVGDLLLMEAANRISRTVLDGGTVARLGGDEFAVLLPHVDSPTAVLAVGTGIRAALVEPFELQGLTFDLDASIGAVHSSIHGQNCAVLMQRADIAMYHAKRHRTGVALYDPEQDQTHPDQLRVTAELRHAIQSDELVLHYQPLMTVATGEVTQVEALVRWNHPTRGLLAPGDFIPLAEHTGLIEELTDVVLDLALRQCRQWLDQGTPLGVSVNLSARNLSDPGIVNRVRDLLDRHQVPAHLLVLEVTESAITLDPPRAIDILTRLDAGGVRIGIDDFGVGYTSLGQLKHMPLHELKVDRSYVTTMTENPDDDLIVRTIIDLGHNLGLRIVAEGVETAEVLASLSGLGCDLVQGYHLTRPLPADELADWLRDRTLWSATPSDEARLRPGAPVGQR